jgi:nicotinamide mononucleotide transporter
MLSAIDILGAAIGLVYIVSEYRASRWFWPSSLLMSAFYLVIDLQARYYANASICLYNFVMSVYGLLVWRGLIGWGHKADAPERPITSCPRRLWPPLALVVALLAVLLWWLLRLTGESQLPWVDGLSSALTIVGMWMLARKWWQQWFCWLLVEPLMIYLFLRAGLYASALLYVVYTVFCILGLIRWRRLCKPAGTPS